jgi:hypothetical protein
MSRLRKLSLLSWLGLFGAPWIWVAQHGIGPGAAEASCSVAGRHWGVSNDAYQIVLLVVAGVIILISEAAALLVLRATADASYHDAPPVGRIRMVAIATASTNLIFLVIIVLDAIASLVNTPCLNS